MTVRKLETETTGGSMETMSFCRICGGDRCHLILYSGRETWQDEDTPVYGGDKWSTLLCAGCRTASFVHEHWFSEDGDYIDSDFVLNVHREIYPPSLPVKQLDYTDLVLSLTFDEAWIAGLLQDVYAAAGLRANSLAAMGARAIIDHLVTARANDGGTFPSKVSRLRRDGLIDEALGNVIVSAFDAGSAAAHRGYKPSTENLCTLLKVTELLLELWCIHPAALRRQAREMEHLRANTPKRPANLPC